MTEPVLVPRRSPAPIVVSWLFGAIAAIGIGLFAPSPERAGWLGAGAGLALLVAFAVNLAMGEAHGFIVRVAASAVGAVVVMGAVSLVFALAAIAPA
ncbi:hypothetical protein [Microbacterium sp. NPDC055683]